MLVKYWMTKTVATVDADDSMQEAVGVMKEHHSKLLPVLKDGRLLGVVTDRDLKQAAASDASALETYELAHLIGRVKIRDVMTKPAITVPHDYTLEEAASLLSTNEISGAPVVDSGGCVIGIISRREIFLAIISLTGLANRGIQLAVRVENRPGSIKEITDIVRKYEGRLVSLLTSYGRAPGGYRHLYLRACRVNRNTMAQMLEELRLRADVLYVVDHRENIRTEYIESYQDERGQPAHPEAELHEVRKILFCTDFSENSLPARNRAIQYARTFNAELSILHVVSSTLVGYPFVEEALWAGMAELQSRIDNRVQLELQEVAKQCGRGCVPIKTYVRSGVVATEIVRFADEASSDLIVMGTHGWSGLKHMILGGTAENVLRTANCPVLIVRSREA